MPPQHVDFGSPLPTISMFDYDATQDRVPGAWLGDSGHEEPSDPNMTISKARAIAEAALADLQRAAAEAKDERLGRHLRERVGARHRERRSAAAKGGERITEHPLSIRAMLAQDTLNATNALTGAPRRAAIHPSFNFVGTPEKSRDAVRAQGNASNTPASASRRAAIDPSLVSGGSYDKPSHAIRAQGNISNSPASAPRRPQNGNLLESGGQNASQARTHERGFLSPKNDFNARGGAHTAATRRLLDGGFFSENQLAAAAERASLRADERALDGQVAQEDRLAAARARLAAKSRVVPAASHQMSSPASHAVKGGLPLPPRPEPAQACITLGPTRLPTRKMETCVSAGTAQSGFSTADDVKQPLRNRVVVGLSSTGGSKAEVEAGRRSTGHSGNIRIHPSYGSAQAPKSPSAKLATAAASTTTIAPSHSLSEIEKAQTIAERYASFVKASRKPAQKVAAQKLVQGAERVDFVAEKETPTKSTAAASATTPTPSQSVSMKALAILDRCVETISTLDDASVATLVAHKLNQDTGRTNFGAGKEPSTSTQPKAPTTQSTKGQAVKSDVLKTAEVDDGFDVVNSKSPSADNGRPLRDPDLIMHQLDVESSPTMKGFHGWEDDYDSDDSEEWDLGGLAEWKWIGEKSAKKSSAAKRQA